MQKAIRVREQTFQALKRKGFEAENEPSRSRVPTGQKAVKKWPVLDLGIHPIMDVSKWRISVTSSGDDYDFTRQVTLQELKEKCGVREYVCDMHCVTTWTVLDMNMKGIPFKEVIEYLKPNPSWKYLLQFGADGYRVIVTRQDIEENINDIFIAIEYNGEPLSREHGYVRLIIPQLFGWKGSKFLTGIEFTEHETLGFWELRGSHLRGRVAYNERWDIQPSEEAPKEVIEKRFQDEMSANYLNLKGLGMSKIPEIVFTPKFASLTDLVLDNNKLTTIDGLPFEQLRHLCRLSINGNQLQSLPENIGSLEAMEELYLVNNKLKSLPKSLGKLHNLVSIWIDDNEVEEIPIELFDIPNLLLLTANNNKIYHLPAAVSKWKKLRCLILRGNPINNLPDEICELGDLSFIAIDEIEGVSEQVMDQGTSSIINFLKARSRK